MVKIPRSPAAIALLLFLVPLVSACRGTAPNADVTDTGSTDERMVNRLAVAYAALRDVQAARRLEQTRRYAQTAIDALVGPAGRHGMDYAPPGGLLPPDGPTLGTDEGLVLTGWRESPEPSPLRAVIDQRVLGGVDGWRTPAARYDAIDAAVAAYAGRPETIAALPGQLDQALAWALLCLKAENPTAARPLAVEGAKQAQAALNGVREARAKATR